MYASSLNDLGRFYVPEYIKEDWIPHVRYIPEPPKPIKGAMNPWQQERQRVLWMEEERAWKEILPLQAEWTRLVARATSLIARYNQLIWEIEDLTGKKSGLQQATGIIGKMPNPYLAIGALLVDLLSGLFSNKKGKIESKVRELEAIQAELAQIQERLATIQVTVQALIGTAERVHSVQVQHATFDVQQSEALYSARQATERARGQARRAVYQQTKMVQAMKPSDAL